MRQVKMLSFVKLALPSAAVGVLCLVIGGCAKGPSEAEPPLAYVWPVDRCPSEPAPTPIGIRDAHLLVLPILAGALASVGLGTAVSTLVGIPTEVIARAAQADASGYSISSVNARYYYTDLPPQPADVKNNTRTLAPPKCYIIAAYKQVHAMPLSPASWCSETAFNRAVPESCQYGKPMLDQLTLTLDNSMLPLSRPPTVQNLGVPDLYAEIGFDEVVEVLPEQKPSNGGPPTPGTVKAEVVIPKVRAIFYPASLLSKQSARPRSLTVGITLSQVVGYANSNIGAQTSSGPQRFDGNPAVEASLLNVNFSVMLNGLVPSGKITPDTLAPYPAAWTMVPSLNQSFVAKNWKDGNNGQDLVPVNATIQVHEIGDPNIFLAAFADAVKTAPSDYSKAVVAAVLPPQAH